MTIFYLIRGALQKFCIVDTFSVKNQRMNFKPKQLYSPGYITYFST